jgi:hypothetical protein
VRAVDIHVLSFAIDKSHSLCALGAWHWITCSVVSNSEHLGHSAWSCTLFRWRTFPTGAKPPSHLGIHNKRFIPSFLIASFPASQSIDRIFAFGMLRLLLQWSNISVDFACSYSVFLSQDDNFLCPIHKLQPYVDCV